MPAPTSLLPHPGDPQEGNSPKVSVCIDVCNYEAFLPKAIESVLDQDFGDFELIIVDDASQDGSFSIAQDYAARDDRIVARRNPSNLGMVKNRNVCLRAARGEYVKILHADDFLRSENALGKMVVALDQNPGISLVASAMQVLSPSLKKSRPRFFFADTRPLIGSSVITRCLQERRNLIGPPSATMFRRRLGLRGFDENFFHAADWEMWLHLLEQGCFGAIPEALVTYRQHQNQQTEKDKLTLSQYEDTLGLLDRYLDRPYVGLSRISKNALRHRAEADYVQRRRQLNLPDEPNRIARHGSFQLRALAPFYSGYRQLLKLQRLGERLGQNRRQPKAKGKDSLPPGLNVAGFFKGEYGIGDSSRAFCEVIAASTIPAVFLNIQSRNHRNQDPGPGNFSKTNPYAVNLMTFSFDYARRFSRDQGSSFFKHRYNIALWYWELEQFPPRWHSSFGYYDEIWTATSFCQKALAAVAPIPVTRIGYPFPREEMPAPDREAFGLPRDSFLFLFNFDFHSVVQRKNPEGLITAFRKAFGKGNDVLLILKSINAEHHPESARELKRLSESLNVRWINEHLEAGAMKQLFATSDCYVSLHRSEGLGLGMARAMSYGKPVIATGYSGNLDFTTPENSLLVRHRVVELDQDYGVYEKGNCWAEPDIDHAAEQMRWVFEHPEEARALGQKARTDLQKFMNPANALDRMRQRLNAIDIRFNSL